MPLSAPSAGPSITGTPSAGQTLTASLGGAYQWLRDGLPISGATSRTYVVQSSDAGHALSVAVTPISAAVTPPTTPNVWAHSKTITVDHTKVAGALTNITLAVDLTSDTQVAASAAADLSDLRFVDAAGGALTYEVESHGGSETNVDNGWCWFNGPRAVCVRGNSVNKVHLCGVTSGGSVAITQLNVDSGAVATTSLHSALDSPMDDHDAAGLFVRADGKLQAFYSSHNSTDGKVYQRVSSAVNDSTAFAAETSNVFGAGTQNVSYPKPFLLSSQGTVGTGRLWLFWRNANDAQWFSYSDDQGATWVHTGKPLFTSPDTFPYFTTPVSNGVDRIDFFCTNSHPRIVDTSFYHFYYSATDDSFHRSDGTVIVTRTALDATNGITPSMLNGTSSQIFVAGSADKRAWGWDACYDASGKPVVVYATFPDTTNFTVHKYHYARWTGTAWADSVVTDAGPATDGTGAANVAGTVGPWIGPAPQAGTIERQYSGGISILRSDTSKVYLSKRVVSPITDQSSWEIEKWATADNGVTWARAVRCTPGSRQKNIRPLCPNNPGALTVTPPETFWMHGGYYHYRQYSTSFLAYPPISVIPAKRGARVLVPAVDNVTDVAVTMKYGNPNATDASGAPYSSDTQMAVPLLGRPSSGNVWHHADVQMSAWTGLTLSAWATLSGADSITDNIFSNWLESGTTDPAVLLRANNGALSGFLVVNADTQIGGAFADKTGLNDGVLHHYALVYDEVALKLYVDGVVSTTTFASSASIDISQGLTTNELQQPAMIGKSPGSLATRPIKTSVTDVRIYNTAKSLAWIQTMAKARAAAPLFTVGSEQ